MGIPLNIDFVQILLHLFNFAILFFVLYFVLYRPVKKIMDQRVKYYEDMDAEAAEKIATAEATEAEYKERMADVESEIAIKNAEAQKTLAAAAESQVREAREKADQILEDARKNAEAERAAILANAQEEIQELAITAAQKIVAADPYDQFLDLAEESK